MKSFYRLENTIRDYAWGDNFSIPGILGIDNPAGSPVAELWMGAHPGSSSLIVDSEGKKTPLNKFTAENPDEVIGTKVSADYGRLPFLFKLLAAGKSLSIQAHPDKLMAEEGFARENSAGIALDSPLRNYKDDNHKPEIIMALSLFTAMIGFRKPEVIADIFSDLESKIGYSVVGSKIMAMLREGRDEGLKPFLESILNAEQKNVDALLNAAESGGKWNKLQEKWVPLLLNQFPGDVGCLAPLFLNLVELKPGQALYQPARALHAYLNGFGLELMANSDNVLRGGLTPKKVDVPELLSVLDFKTTTPEVLTAQQALSGFEIFKTPAREFELGICRIDGKDLTVPSGTGPAIYIVLEGSVSVSDGEDVQELVRGESVFIMASAGELRLSGNGRIAAAGIAS